MSLALAGGFFLPLRHHRSGGKHKLGIKPDEIRYDGPKLALEEGVSVHKAEAV